MANSSLRKPGVFSKLWSSVKPAVVRFPALLVLGIVTAVAFAHRSSSYVFYGLGALAKHMEWLACAGACGMAFSALAVIFAVSIFALRRFFRLSTKCTVSCLLAE